MRMEIVVVIPAVACVRGEPEARHVPVVEAIAAFAGAVNRVARGVAAKVVWYDSPGQIPGWCRSV